MGLKPMRAPMRWTEVTLTPAAANPDHSAPGLGFRLSYDTNCQIKS